jgi:arylsulfatase A-like enzyme
MRVHVAALLALGASCSWLAPSAKPTALRVRPQAPTAADTLRCAVATGDASAAVSWVVGERRVAGPELDLSALDLRPGAVVRCEAETEARGHAVTLSESVVVRPAARATPPNVLVLLADDLGVDKLRRYDPPGKQIPRTPHLDALADEGVTFDRAYSNPVCSPTRAAILTGRHARRTGVGTGVSIAKDDPSLPLDEVLLPEVLSQAPTPYRSAAVGKWHLASTETRIRTHPIRQGFTAFAGSASNLYEALTPGGEAEDYSNWTRLTPDSMARTRTYATTVSVDDALAFAERLPEPWLMYVAFHAPHAPFHSPPADLVGGRPTPPGDAGKYDRMVEALDHEIGRLLAGLGDQRSRTDVFFLGDNGTPSRATRPPFPSDRAKGTLFEGGDPRPPDRGWAVRS